MMGTALLLALHTSPSCASSIRTRRGFCFLMEMLDTMTEVAPLYAVQIVQKMGAVARGASAAPLHIYCGHDTTIMPILATLGIKLRDWPPYLSHVVGFHWCCCVQARDGVVLQKAILGCCHRNGHGCTDECSSAVIVSLLSRQGLQDCILPVPNACQRTAQHLKSGHCADL